MRILNLCVVMLLLAAAAYVYQIKFDATMRAERVAKLRYDIQRERDAIAELRAEWSGAENPARVQALARRHLKLRPADSTQYDSLNGLPDRPIVVPPVADRDAIAEQIEKSDFNPITGSVQQLMGSR